MGGGGGDSLTPTSSLTITLEHPSTPHPVLTVSDLQSYPTGSCLSTASTRVGHPLHSDLGRAIFNWAETLTKETHLGFD